MEKVDVWFTQFRGKTYFTFSRHDDFPLSRPLPAKSIGSAIRAVKHAGYEVVQTGICPSDMMGL